MITMRRQGLRAALLAGAAVAAVLVVGCGAGQTTSGNATASPAAQPNAATSPASSGQPGAVGGQQVAVQAGGTAVSQCSAGELTATLGNRTSVPVDVQGQLGAAGAHYSIPLIWTNHSTGTCTMTGFGGVDVDGPDLGATGGPTYSLPRNTGTPGTVTLSPGSSAHTVISYIDPSGSPNPLWTPTHLEVTPPNETTHLSVPWTAGTPVYQDPQDGAVAASISPVTPGT